MQRSRKWSLGAGALIVAACMAVAGCAADAAGSGGGSGKPPASLAPIPPEEGVAPFRAAEPGSGKGLKLGLIALGDSVPFGKSVTDSVREQAEAAGAELVVCDAQLDAAKALDCARNLKSQGVDGYLNFQADAKAAPSICEAGPQVPVVAIDIVQPPCQKAFMGANNEYAGYLAGRALGEYFQRKFDCEYDVYVSMESHSSGELNGARMGGYRKGFEEVCGEVHDLRTIDADRIDKARTVFTDVLTSMPGRNKVIVAGINDDAVLGALAAARTQGREGDLHVSAQGADPSAWCQIKNNPQWVGDTAYFPERYGEIGVPALIDLIKGNSTPENLYVKHEIVNAGNIDDHYQLTEC